MLEGVLIGNHWQSRPLSPSNRPFPCISLLDASEGTWGISAIYSTRLLLPLRELVPHATIKKAASGLLADAEHTHVAKVYRSRSPPFARSIFSKLLEEKRNASRNTLISETPDPYRIHRPRTGAALPAADDPIESFIFHLDRF